MDTAYVTPMIMLRPDPHNPGNSRPQAALVVRYPGTAGMRELVIRGLLRRRWNLVAAPVGRYAFPPGGGFCGRVYLANSTVRVVVGETLYDGPLPLSDDPAGDGWRDLATGTREVAVYVTVGTQPILRPEDADDAARAGQLVGVVAELH